MLHTRITKILDGFKIHETDRKNIDRLLERPEVQAVFNNDEVEQIAYRKALIKELEAVPAQIESEKQALGKVHNVNVKRFEAAKTEYFAAMAEFYRTEAPASNSGYQLRLKEKHIKQELVDSSDPRIHEHYWHIRQLEGRIRSKIECFIESKKEWTGTTKSIFSSNADDVARARKEVNKALATLDALQLKAITSAEVTQALKEITNALKDPLGALDMFPPTIDEHGQVIQPHLDGAPIKIEQVA